LLSLYLLRHGETDFSREDRFCGRIDAPLTDIGKEMAWCFAEMYGELDWRAIYTSTRQRAISTAEPLATRISLTPQQEPGLDEMDYGEWQGRWKGEVAATDRQRYQSWREDPTMGAPGGESVFEVHARASRVVDEIRARYDDGNVLVVSHKTTLRVLVCGLLGVDLRLHRDRIAQPVCGLSIIEILPEGPALRALADVTHLPSWLRARAVGSEPTAAAAAAPAPGHADETAA
jgi:probable phosphoglycerate mutase